MHCGVVSAIIRQRWLAIPAAVRRSLRVVRVHSAFAGVINAGFLAARMALPEHSVQLGAASECVWWRREALRAQYPAARMLEDARDVRAFAEPYEILVASWPCHP